MAIGLSNNDGWFDTAFISICQLAGSEVQMRSFTTNLSISGGGFDTEALETFAGQINRTGAYDEVEISIDGIPASVRDFDWLVDGVSPTATTITSSSKVKTRVTFLWTDKTGVTAATEAIASGSDAYRQIYADMYCTGVEYSMDAGAELTATLNFKGTKLDTNGNLNYKKEMCGPTASTVSLGAVASYTGSTKY